VATLAKAPRSVLAEGGIVIIDDQRTMRAIVRTLLTESGFTEVREAEDGEEALEMLESPDPPVPSVIICDLHMARMDGMQFCNALRRHKWTKIAEIPAIMLTGDSDRFMHDVARQVGAVRVLTKPISAPDLAAEVARTIGFQA